MESWKAEHSRRVSRWSAQKRSQVSRKKMHWREMCCVFPMILVSAILVSSAGLWPAGFPFPAFLPMQVLHRCGYEPTWHSCASFSDAPLRRASVADPDLLGPCAPDRQNINHSTGRLTDFCRRWDDLQFLAHAGLTLSLVPSLRRLARQQSPRWAMVRWGTWSISGQSITFSPLPTAAKVSWLGRTSGMPFHVS